MLPKGEVGSEQEMGTSDAQKPRSMLENNEFYGEEQSTGLEAGEPCHGFLVLAHA